MTTDKTLDSCAVLFVCLGNICRSPTAHGVFAEKVRCLGLENRVQVDSAGTAAYHAGSAPDPRSSEVARSRGYDLSRLRARQAVSEDFHQFDYILAMDESNLRNLQAIAPVGAKAALRLFLDFDRSQPVREVPDPYYGGEQGFTEVLDLVEAAADGLLTEIRSRLKG